MKYKNKELSIISENLFLLYSDGLNFTKALEIIQDIPMNKKYKNSLEEIKKSLLRGNSLASSFNEFKELYPSFFIGMIRVGEESGNLDKVFKNLNTYYKQQNNIRNKIIKSISYPALLLSVMIILSFVFLIIFVPIIYSTFCSTGNNIPTTVNKVYMLANSIRSEPLVSLSYLFCFGIIIPLIFFYVLRGKVKLSKCLSKIKIIKQYYEYSIMIVMSLILNSGISLVSGLNISTKDINNNFIKEELSYIHEYLLNGKELSEAMRKESKVISKYTLSMISLGEQSGSLNEVVNTMTQRLQDNTYKQLESMSSKIQPTLIIIMAILIGIFIVSFIMPIFDMMYQVK